MNYISVKMSYKASGLYGIDNEELKALKNELRDNYITHIAANGGPQAGGLVDAVVEVMLDTTFVDFFTILRDGFIFDTVTRGKKSFLLKPLFDAFQRMESKSKYWDYSSVRFLFHNTEVTVYGAKDMFTSRLGVVFDALSKHYNKLGEPYQIAIPIAKVDDGSGNINYVVYEAEEFQLEDYSLYWGISYDAGFERKVYDVRQSRLIDFDWS